MLSIVITAWQRRSTRGAVYMALLGISIIVYSLGYIFELGSSTIPDILAWLKTEYIGIVTQPVFLLMLILTYTGRRRLLVPLNIIIALIIPVATLLFAWTNEYHGLIWQNMGLVPLGRYVAVDFTPGPWYWVWVAYTLFVAGGSAVLLVNKLRKSSGLLRKQLRVILAGILIPLAAYLIYLTGLTPDALDLNPYALTLSGLVIAWGMFNYRLFDIVPVAHTAVLASMQDAVIVLDEKDRVVDLNLAAQQLMRTTAEQNVGLLAREVFDHYPELLARYRDVHRAREEIEIDIQGETHFFDFQLSPLRSQTDQHQGRLVVLRDITDRVLAENALKKTNQLLTILRGVDAELSRKLDVDYVASMALDAAIRMSLADAAFIALSEENGLKISHALGRYPEDAIGRTLLPDQIHIDGAKSITDPTEFRLIEQTRAQILAPLLSGQKLIGILILETHDPTRFTPDAFETVELLAAHVGIAIDNAYMYEERDKLVNELEAFAHTVAHDLKNPLSVIIGSGGFLLDSYNRFSEEHIKEYLKAMTRNAEKAADIIEALLTLAGVRTLSKIEIRPLDMDAIVEEVQLRLSNLIQEYGAEITMPYSWAVAKGYAPWIEEIWANYLSNAIKYGGRPPRISLGSNLQDDGTVRFWIRDNGKGLTEEEQAQLFRPFTRLDQVDVEGHGLGLSIVQRIAERLNGEVGVESQVGKGSLFYFTLPAAESEA